MASIIGKTVGGHTYYYLRDVARVGGKPKVVSQTGVPQLVGIFGGPDRYRPWSGRREARSESKSVGTRLLD